MVTTWITTFTYTQSVLHSQDRVVFHHSSLFSVFLDLFVLLLLIWQLTRVFFGVCSLVGTWWWCVCTAIIGVFSVALRSLYLNPMTSLSVVDSESEIEKSQTLKSLIFGGLLPVILIWSLARSGAEFYLVCNFLGGGGDACSRTIEHWTAV